MAYAQNHPRGYAVSTMFNSPPRLRFVLFCALTFLACQCAMAQSDPTVGQTRPPNPEIPGIVRAPGPRSLPTKSGPAADYSGVSGPGQPVIGTGYGGYRTGREGVMYRGPDPKPGWLDFGKRALGTAVANGLLPPLRPIWDVHIRDTSICLADDGFYYMTGSTGDNIWDLNDGVELYRSADLKTWDYLGLVWSVDRDGTWEKQFRYVWAPEIHYVGHNFVIAYCLNGGANGQGGGTGLLVSKTGKPEGPYINPVASDRPLTGGIDATVFEDDDGKIYFTNGAGGTLHLMKSDLSAFDGPPIRAQIVADPKSSGPTRIGHEGAAMFKANGRYYLTAADTYQGRYSSIAGIADNIAGPYTKIHEAVPCGAGGGYFKDKAGNWWCTYFGNDDQSPWREKPGIVRIDFDAGGKIFIADDQPAFVLQAGANTHWRKTPRAASTQP
ncbi:MAG: family 43 glycosylhydrolase [Tepidisphaeraceae bacterium]